MPPLALLAIVATGSLLAASACHQLAQRTTEGDGAAGIGGLSETPGATGGRSTPDSAADEGGLPGVAILMTLHRLTNREYDNTARDLLGVTATPALFQDDADDGTADGFDNLAENLHMSPGRFERYLAGAKSLVDDVWATPALKQRLLASAPNGLGAPTPATIASFGLRAWRRPLTPDEVTGLTSLYHATANTLGLDEAMKRVATVILSSLPFLYKVEGVPATATAPPLPLAGYGPWGGHIEPSHGNLCGAWLTCVPASGVMNENRGISVDQVLAKALGGATPLDSLQVGLSTLESSPDGLPGQQSRSISWKSATEPLYKIVSPQAIFNRLFGMGLPPRPGDSAADRSVLDQVLAQVVALQAKVSGADRARLDEYLTSVRAVEMAVMQAPPSCLIPARPTETYDVGMVPPEYNRDHHANLLVDLVALALQCDITRFVSFMLDDARSDFVYSFLTTRDFTPTGSTPGVGPVGSLYGLSNISSTSNGWATIVYWFVERLAQLCLKLAAVPDGPGGTLLDQSVVWFGSEMHSLERDAQNLPLLHVGSGGGRLKVGQHVDLKVGPRNAEDLANVYLTFLRRVFDLPAASFGLGHGDHAGAGHRIVPEIVA